MPPANINRKLQANGTCLTCDKDAQAESMTCHRCKNRFHVFECGELHNQTTETFLKNWAGLQLRYPSFSYTCESCRENVALKNEDILVNRLALMEENINFLVTEIKSMKENAVPAAPATYAAAVHTPPLAPVVEKPAVIVIENKAADNDEARTTKITKLKDAAVESSASVVKTYQNGVKDTVLICHNESSKEKLMPHVKKIFPDQKVTTPQSRMPTVNIHGMESEVTKDELLNIVKQQNRDNGLPEVTSQNFIVIFIKLVKSKNARYPDTYSAAVRVSDEIRHALKAAGDRIFINLTSCRVTKRLFVRRCNRCQEYKHFHKDCNSENMCCGKCGGAHDTRSCTSDIKRCINCVNNKFTDVEHETWHHTCQSYKKEQDKLEKTIPYYQTAKNLETPNRR